MDCLPFLSIIMCAYNNEQTIKTAINSIINQTFNNYELIIVNDASYDNTDYFLKEYQSKYPYIKIINNYLNVGLGKSRNIAIKQAEGEYITFFDADDYFYYNNFLSDVYYKIVETKADLIFTPYIRENNKRIRYDKVPDSNVYDMITSLNFYISRKFGTHGACAKFFKSEIFDYILFNEYGYSEDVNCIFNSISYSKKTYFYKRYGYVYVNNINSITQKQEIKATNVYSSIRLLIEIIKSQCNFYKKGVEVTLKYFIETWKENHLPKIIQFWKNNKYEFEYCNIIPTRFRSIFYKILNLKDYDNLFLNSFKKYNFQIYDKRLYDYISSLKLFKSTKDKKQIVIIASHLASGGLEKVAAQLSTILTTLGYNIYFILDDSKRINYKFNGEILSNDISNPKTIIALSEAKYIFNFRFMYTSEEYPDLLYIIDNFPEKLVPTIHNTNTCDHYIEKINFYLDNELSKVNKIICVSQNVKNHLTKKYPKSFKSEVLYNPIDFSKIDSSPKQNTIDFSYILFIGRLTATKHKGIDILLETYFESKIYKKYNLILAGSGTLDNNLVQYIKNKNLETKINCLGFTDNIYSYIKGSEFTFQPSRWEGFSLAVIESLACGIPVLTTNVGGALEVIKHKHTGYIAKVEDKQDIINGLKFMDKNAVNMRGKCRTTVEFLSFSNYSVNLKKMFDL